MRLQPESNGKVVELKIEHFVRYGVPLVRCTGRITFEREAELLRNYLRKLLPHCTKCVLSLAGVRQIDARGLGTLVECYCRARSTGCLLLLADVPQHISDLLHVTRLAAILESYPSEEDAILACCQVA